jgi:rSAM/selenodomain-associated transferase 2
MLVSIIIPVFNEARTISHLAATLDYLQGEYEVIVVDGESTDRTRALARAAGLKVITAPRGRGPQMNAGARIASGEVLLFLHADTKLPETALLSIATALQSPEVCGGNFSLCFEGKTIGARLLTRIYPWLRKLGLIYGDSAIFVRRAAFETIGGYQAIPLFEDCDLYRRLRRTGQFVRLKEYVTTSARRFEGRFLRTFLFWTAMQVLYWLGVAPHYLARAYRSAR